MIIGILLTLVTLGIVSCSAKDTTPIKATWIDAQISGDVVFIPASEVENNGIVHFKLATLDGDMAFMSYELENKNYVRSNICPPCMSMGFSLQDDTLVCDTCATTFDAKSGEGIAGACVDFPKAFVPYKVIDNNIIMGGANLITAHQNTLIPGLP